MLAAIERATLGDDVFLDDKDTTNLEAFIAELTGFPAALLVVSGTMGNQLSIRTHLGGPPHSIVADARSHIIGWWVLLSSLSRKRIIEPTLLSLSAFPSHPSLQANLPSWPQGSRLPRLPQRRPRNPLNALQQPPPDPFRHPHPHHHLNRHPRLPHHAHLPRKHPQRQHPPPLLLPRHLRLGTKPIAPHSHASRRRAAMGSCFRRRWKPDGVLCVFR